MLRTAVRRAPEDVRFRWATLAHEAAQGIVEGSKLPEAYKLLDISRRHPEYGEMICEDGQILASVIYAVQNESARTLEDIVMRRTGVGNIGHPGQNRLEKIAAAAQKELGWDNERMTEEVARVDRLLRLPE